GKLLVGAHRPTSEVRSITGGRFTTDGNSITLAASGGVTASGATLTGGDNANSPASGTLTVTTATGTKTITIDGFILNYTGGTGDTTSTVAGMVAAMINSHPILTRYITADWTP